MTALRKRLLELYSKGPIEKAHASDAYQELLNEHEGDRPFDGERNLIQELRSLVDLHLGNKEFYRLQIEFALRLLRRLDTRERKETCRTLILMSEYAKRWEAIPLRYFEQSSLVLIEAVDYFLSFTSRNPSKPNQNEVNRLHKHFIIDSIGQRAYDQADLSERNLVAEAVHYHLGNRLFQGFYFPNHVGDNTVVEEKIRTNCIKALAFVQLMQAAIFSNKPGSQNWCFFEYDLVRKKDADRILFVQIEEGIRADKIEIAFDEWYKTFAAVKDPLRLDETRWDGPEAIDGNRKKIREKLVEQIERAENRIYLEIPN